MLLTFVMTGLPRTAFGWLEVSKNSVFDVKKILIFPGKHASSPYFVNVRTVQELQ